MDFYRMTKLELFKNIKSSKDGLSAAEAEENIRKYGANELEEGKKKSPVIIFLEQYKDFLVIILIISAIISGIMGDAESGIIILTVITINAILGTVQTLKAEQSLKGLKAMSAPEAKVIRDGKLTVIKGSEVTVGDVVVAEAGDFVCADGRIIEIANLKADESALTGESEPVTKDDIDITSEKPLGDRVNMLYSGSFVTYGRAKMLVTAVGMSTEMGKIASLLKQTKERKTPLQESLDDFGKKLSYMIMAVCVLVFILSALRGEKIADAFIFAVALAVAAIPEALSSIVTIVLASGTRILANENAIIRKLQSVEGLGSVSVICSDKTGTLTQNKMTVQKIYFDGNVIDKDENISCIAETLVRDGVLCSDATRHGDTVTGDPTEIALIDFAQKHSIDADRLRSENKRINEIPFDSDRKLMSTVYRDGESCIMITKGAVDVMLAQITQIMTENGVRSFTDDDREKLIKANSDFSKSGLRVLAICEKSIEEISVTTADEKEFTLIGLAAMQDPPREESAQAVAKCKSAGIRPIMITGDHLVTASAIARDIGILDDNSRAVEGSEIENLSDDELDTFVTDVSVYARVSPEHKIRIVRAWQRKGCIVAMTGDGVNDAPALKQADVGVAMGITGSEVAKDSASVVLADDNFATIVKAVETGRNIYRNIQRAVQFLLSGNTAAIIAVVYASLMALPLPFYAVHLLFINLLTDSLPAIALGVEPHSSDVMYNRPRPKNQSILTRHVMERIITEGLVIAAATLTGFYIGLMHSPEKASAMAFAVLCLTRLVHGFNCKSDSPVWFRRTMWNNKQLIGAFLIGCVLLSAVLFIPFLQPVFKTVPLTAVEIIAVYGLPVAAFAVIQALKSLRERKS